MPLSVADVPAFVQEWDSKFKPRRLRVGCAIDGSAAAEKTYEAMARMCTPDMDVFVLHVAPARSAGSDYHESPAHLMRQYEMHQMHFVPLVRHQFVSREKTPGITTAEALVQLADKCALDLLFMGTHGRKGPKSALGSTANAAMRQSACSVCLAQRPTSHDVASKRKWVVAVDGGRASLMAFSSVLKSYAHPGDTICVWMADFKQASEASLEPFRAALEQDGRFTFETLFVMMPDQAAGLEHPNSVPESIVTRAERANADFLVLGIAGLTKLGSVCEDILNQGSHVPVLMHKDDQEVGSKRHHLQGRTASLLGR